ncbi:MAG TPA: zinc-ribbon domain-containing protein [Candidatus Omnitrophica bacterium]|nr:zinc-ribbon domain-containing protein [Candidatus Omnitrophota bacterium]
MPDMPERWKVKKTDGSIYGPVDTETIRRWIEQKRVSPDDYIALEGKEEWKFASSTLVFSDLFRAKAETGEEVPSAQRRCPNCRNILPSEATFCTKCGTDLKTGKKASELLITKEKQARIITTEQLVLTALIILGGLGAFLFLKYLHPVKERDALHFIIPVIATMGELACLYFLTRLLIIIIFIKKTPTTKINDIKGSGFFEVKGKVVCPSPEGVYGLRCVYYEYAHYIRTHTYRGRGGSKYVRDIYEKKSVPFAVKDESGQIGVEPAGAYFEPKVLRRGGGLLEGEEDILKGITVNDEVYVFGEVVQYDGTLQFEKGRGMLPLLISSKPESRLAFLIILRIILLILLAGIIPVGAWRILLEIL